MTTAKQQAPWRRGNPKADGDHQALSPQAKAAAKRRAQKAGRPYPNLVDNMHEAQHTDGKQPAGSKPAAKQAAKAKPVAKRAAAKKATGDGASKAPRKATSKATSKATTKTAAKTARTPAKQAAAKKPAAKATKDPKGGLTAAGRAEFARKDGAQLKPGVTKPMSEMTPEDMRRKGSWAVRFYGRETLPPLKKANGEPTRFALSAHAWGEPVPKTEAQARKIAAKGERLLKRYEAAKAKDKAAKAKTKASH